MTLLTRSGTSNILNISVLVRTSRMPSRSTHEIDGLTERQRLAVDLLARGKTCREVARSLNITERTLYAWRRKPVVQRAIYATQQELMDSGGGQGITVVPQAVATLAEIMNDPEARAADRIAASRALISGASAYQERKLLERTIADLESQIYGLTARRSPEVEAEPVDLDLLPSANPEEAE